MANTDQLAILKQGVEAWNAWRAEHLDVDVDLSHAVLTGGPAKPPAAVSGA